MQKKYSCQIIKLDHAFEYIYNENNWEDWEYFLEYPELASLKTLKPLRQRFLTRVDIVLNETYKKEGKSYDKNLVGEKGLETLFKIKIPYIDY